MGNLCSTPKTNYKASVALAQEYKGVTFEAVSGDIIEAEADAIVNGTNPQLSHSNGLGNNLLSKGGQVIQEESDKIRASYESDLPIGSAVVTKAGHLKARHIIHVVTPIWNGGSNNEENKLGECVLNALTKAEELKLKSIAVPSLAGGVMEFPKEQAARIIVQNCVQYLDKVESTSLQNIKFVNTNVAFVNAFKEAVQHSLRAGELNGNNINLAREETDTQTDTQFVEREREEISITKAPEQAHTEKRVASRLPPAEEEEAVPVTQVQTEEKREEQAPVVEEKPQEIVHEEKPVEQIVEQPVEEKQVEEPVIEQKQEEVPVVEEKVVEEEKPVEQIIEQPVEEKQEEAPVEEKVVEEPVVEEEKTVVEEPVVEEKQEEAPVEEKVVEEEKPVEEEKAVVEEPVVEEKQEEVPVTEEKQEEAPVEEKVVEEEKPVEETVQETEVKTEEQPVEESKEAEVEEKKEDETTTQAESEATTQAEVEGEGGEGEEGAQKKNAKKKKNKKKN